MVQLLDDLCTAVEKGIPESLCKQIRSALARVVNSATTIPDGSILRTAIWRHIQNFEGFYKQWNDVNGSDSTAVIERTRIIKLMRNERHSIAVACRRNHHILNNELDLELITSFYHALGEAAKSSPEILSQLVAAVSRFEKGSNDKQ
jgi:hypothetical protein